MLELYRQSPVQLHITLGAAFILAVVERNGVEGWNCWIRNMVDDEYMPLSWLPGHAEPPVWWWLDCDGADISHRDLSGADLRRVSLRKAVLDGSSLVGTVFGSCRQTSMRSCDLRDADFLSGDLTATDFTDAKLDEIHLIGAVYDEGHPPIGLPADLLELCESKPVEDTSGFGETEYPVQVRAALTATGNPQL